MPIFLFFPFFFWLFPVFIFYALICTFGKGRGIHNGCFDSSLPCFSYCLVWSLDWQEKKSFDRIRRFNVKVFSQFFSSFGLSLSSAGFGVSLLHYFFFLCARYRLLQTFLRVAASELNRGTELPNTGTDFTPISFLEKGTRFKDTYIIRGCLSILGRVSSHLSLMCVFPKK